MELHHRCLACIVSQQQSCYRRPEHVAGYINAVWEFSSLGDLSSGLQAENAVLLAVGSGWSEVCRGTRPLTSAFLISAGDQPGSYQEQLRTELQHFGLPVLTQSGGHEQG